MTMTPKQEELFHKAITEDAPESADDVDIYLEYPDTELLKGRREKKAFETAFRLWAKRIRQNDGQDVMGIAYKIDEELGVSPFGTFRKGGSSIQFSSIINVLLNYEHARKRMRDGAKEGAFLRFVFLSSSRRKIILRI